MKLCKICGKIGEFHYGQTKCKSCCKIIQNQRTKDERAMLEKAKAEGRGTMEWCRRWNLEHPVVKTPTISDILHCENVVAKVEFGI